MKKLLFLLTLLCFEKALHAQYVYTIKADSVKITNSCDTAELIIENHTQNVRGFLFNKGRGRTEFRRATVKNDSALILGGDTLVLRGSTTAGNGLSMTGKNVQLGQTVGATGNPAVLVSNREIPMNGYDIRLINIGDTGCLKLYAGSIKTTSSPLIQFLDQYGAELGRINFFDTSNSANLAIGRKAGGAQNFGMGAIRNTFIGSEAGMNVTSGSRNTAIGHRALRNATTASGNIAVGGYALQAVTTGIGNFAMGYTAASAITTGSNNIAIGGSQFFGSSIQRLQTGNNNVAIGTGAMSESGVATTNFSDNIGIGFMCFYNNTLANKNIGIGDSLCVNSPVGTGNILLGSSSINSGSKVGNSNVILGSRIVSNGGGAFGDNNIVLGSNFTTTSSLSNVVIIGQGITNNVSNVVRLGRVDQNVIVGATTNIADNGNKLQVNGTGFFKDTLTATTMGSSDNSNRVATTAFVKTAIGAPSLNVITAGTADINVAAGTLTKLPDLSGAGSHSVILPSASSYTGQRIYLWNKNSSGNSWTFSSAITLPNGTTSNSITNQTTIELISDGTAWIKWN